MSEKDLEKSFKTLKSTIPLLLKHKIAAVPSNYALWYTYAANETPELNNAVDEAIDKYKSVSDVRARELYRSHVADENEVDVWDLRQSIEAMLIEMSQTMKDTRSDTNDFRQTMDGCLDDLNKVESEGWTLEEVMGLVRNMVKEAQEIRRSTLTFNAALANAEKEIEELRAQLQQTQHDALYDALTGLCNRRFFDSELDALAEQGKFCLIIADVDHFKKFNDTHGHLMGDQVLKAVAKKLNGACRDGAQAFRFGGEEFAILAPGYDLKRARHLADVMRRAIEKIRIKDKRTAQEIDGITSSFGVAEWGESTKKIANLVSKADKQLYEAKRLGRNRVMPIS